MNKVNTLSHMGHDKKNMGGEVVHTSLISNMAKEIKESKGMVGYCNCVHL